METYSVAFRAMGSSVQAWLCAASSHEVQILASLPARFAEWERIFSRFDPHSELSALNAHTGQWVAVSPTLFAVLELALDMAALTDGLFNPMVGYAVNAAGYDHGFTGTDFTPGLSLPVQPVPDFRTVELRPGTRSVRIPLGAQIDLGGIAKGWAAEQAALILTQVGACLVDAGGDMVGRGAPDDSGGWWITYDDPDDPEACFLLCDAAVATSGTDYRRWSRDGSMLHHLIDPRTGSPAEPSLRTVTVVAPDAAHAECYAKAGLIGGLSSIPDLYPVFALPAMMTPSQPRTSYKNAAFTRLTQFEPNNLTPGDNAS